MALVAFLCAAFALGDAITKACPPGFVRLDADADSCKIAAAAANRTYVGSVAYSYYPFGCYWHTFTDRVYYNGYIGTIEAETYAQPLCAGTAGKRSQAFARSDTHGHTCKHSQCVCSGARADSRLRSQMHSFHAQPPVHARMRTQPCRHTVRLGSPAIMAGAHAGRCGGGHGDSADVRPSERYRPHTPCTLVCMHEHARPRAHFEPPAHRACAYPVPSD